MALVPCALRTRAAASPCSRLDGAASDRRALGHRDERDTRRIECEDQARAGLDPAVAELARGLPGGQQERVPTDPGNFRDAITVRLSAVSRDFLQGIETQPNLHGGAAANGLQPVYSSSFVCAIAIEWLL